MFQRLLICTDLSDGLQRLVHFVPSFAAAGVQQITFLNSVPIWEGGGVPRIDKEGMEKSRQALHAALEHTTAGVDVHVDIESGQPKDSILRVAKERQADLIVMGVPFRSLLSEKLFGSTTMELYRRTPVPLLTVRPQLISTYTSEELDLRCRHLFRSFLVTYDGSQSAKYLVEQIKHRVKAHPHSPLEDCYFCWVVDDGGRRDIPWDYKLKEATQELEQVKAELESELKIKVVVDVRCGNSVVEVLDAALEPDVSAIATSPGGDTKFLEWSVSSFTGDLLRRSWHPVLYFPPKRA